MKFSKQADEAVSYLLSFLQPFMPPILPAAYRRLVNFRNPPPKFELPTRKLAQLFAEIETHEISLTISQMRRHLWGMPEHELLVLGAIARAVSPSRVIEFGTFTGSSTLAIAMNSPRNTKIITVDLEPNNRATHEHGLGIGLIDFEVGEVFRDTRWQSKIEQRFANTRHFSCPEWQGTVSLFFVDADHTYEFVNADSAIAKRMLCEGGVIVWHDYVWEDKNSECAGVTRAVNEFASVYGNCFHIADTRFAIYLSQPNIGQRSSQG